MSGLAQHFSRFRANIVGDNATFKGPYGVKQVLYCDWVASGRLYLPIEEKLLKDFGPFVANTHTETSVTGTRMTHAYHIAKDIIKQHVNANATDSLIMTGSGMTGAINKFQRILGLRIPEKWRKFVHIPEHERPVVFVTHMEHHSNHTSWLETIADVEKIEPDEHGLVNLGHLLQLLDKYAKRSTKIAAITACSNVTGVTTPYHSIAEIMHRHNGLCFVDFACSAPYVRIDMHPENPLQALDAIYFSPHKFLGGPGTPGVLVFCNSLYRNSTPDHPGGGTVRWTNPWKEHIYLDSIEDREDGGTPAFLQTIKTALCIKLKDEMGVDNIARREEELLEIAFTELNRIRGLHIMAGHLKQRQGVVSFYLEHTHYNLVVKLLNDRFGIQVRGGCSCAGTYGHYLLNLDQAVSTTIKSEILGGNLEHKPGWVRLSLHPTLTDEELYYFCDSVAQIAAHYEEWKKDYRYLGHKNEFIHHLDMGNEHYIVEAWFENLHTSAPACNNFTVANNCMLAL